MSQDRLRRKFEPSSDWRMISSFCSSPLMGNRCGPETRLVSPPRVEYRSYRWWTKVRNSSLDCSEVWNSSRFLEVALKALLSSCWKQLDSSACRNQGLPLQVRSSACSHY